jgi:hypothetical protein
MIERKKKECKRCKQMRYLFAKGLCKNCWNGEHRKPIDRTVHQIKVISDARKERDEKYFPLRDAYLAEHCMCEVCNLRESSEIHHKGGRVGDNMFKDFLAVCRECHTRIHDFPEWAKEQGFLF